MAPIRPRPSAARPARLARQAARVRLAAGSLCLAALVLAPACGSTETSKRGALADIEMGELDVVSIQNQDLEIGEFLAKTDMALRAWTNLTNTADSPAERTQARQLEGFLRNETRNRQSELVVQLETGPLYNRMRAASAHFRGTRRAWSSSDS